MALFIVSIAGILNVSVGSLVIHYNCQAVPNALACVYDGLKTDHGEIVAAEEKKQAERQQKESRHGDFAG